MANLNPHLEKLSSAFVLEFDRKYKVAQEKKPQERFLNLGFEDVAKPLTPHLLAALCTASEEMGNKQTFRGYGPVQGYPFLREAILYHEYSDLGISADEIFISNGAKCDLGHLQELFAPDCTIGISDPAYSVFLESNILAGRTLGWSEEKGYYDGVISIPCKEENGFLPLPPSKPCDLVYLCSPNNPTGVALTRKALRLWVDYALEHRAILLYDGAYESYITSEECPHSIYEIEGAREVAIEIRSFSKSAGFTGLRCSWSVIPKNLSAALNDRQVSIHPFWQRRQMMKFGGVPYPVQKCAAALYSPQGQAEFKERIRGYRQQALFLLEGLKRLGLTVFGGIDAPYVWCKTPGGLSSWEFFDRLLEKAHLLCLPGRVFGKNGEGYVRFSSFADSQVLAEGLLRIQQTLENNHANAHHITADSNIRPIRLD